MDPRVKPAGDGKRFCPIETSSLIRAFAVPRLPLGKPFLLLQSRQELDKLVRKRRVDEIVIVGSERPPKGVDSPRVERGVVRLRIVGRT